MDIVSNCLKIQSVAAAVVENFDFWLATLPKKAQKEISVSMVSTQLGIDLATAKQLLEFHTHSPLFFYQIRQSTTSIGAMHRMGVGECLFLIDF